MRLSSHRTRKAHRGEYFTRRTIGLGFEPRHDGVSRNTCLGWAGCFFDFLSVNWPCPKLTQYLRCLPSRQPSSIVPDLRHIETYSRSHGQRLPVGRCLLASRRTLRGQDVLPERECLRSQLLLFLAGSDFPRRSASESDQ